MSIEITTPHDRTIEVSAHRVLYITNTRTGQHINAALSPDEAKKVADALDPDRGVETGYALQVDALTRERDALDSRLTQVYMERDGAWRELKWSRKDRDRLDKRSREANARADAAEAKVRELREQVQRSGSIVYTVEEQDIEAEGRRVEVVDTGRQFNIRIQGQPVNAIKSSTEAREKAQRHIEAAARCEAIARRIETDTAVDPVAQRVDEVANIISAGIFHGTLTPDRILGIAADVVEGLTKDVDPDCPEHSLTAGKTIRQTHRADRCPAVRFNPATDIHMQMTEDYRAPFWESENACITAYGHVDKTELARQVQEYDRHVGADDTDLVPVESIQHVWLRMEDPTDKESLMHKCEPDAPGAFPATTIWNVR